MKFGLPLIEAMNRDRPGLAMTTFFIFLPCDVDLMNFYLNARITKRPVDYLIRDVA